MNSYWIVAIVIVASLFLIWSQMDTIEGSNGALLQLVAKGPQDTYLTGDAWKYYPWPYYGSYRYPYSRYGSRFPGSYIGKYPYYRRRFWPHWW